MPILNIPLPKEKHRKLLVTKGEQVEKGRVLTEFTQSQIISVPLANSLGVHPSRVISFLVKKIGEKVSPGDVLAEKKSFWGKKTAKSPVLGELESLEEKTGNLNIKVVTSKISIKSKVGGVVKEIDNDKMQIEFEGKEFLAKEGAGRKEGKLKVLTGKEEVINLYQLTKQEEGNILLGGKWGSESLAKARTLDCGVIGKEFPKKRWPDLVMALVGQDVFEKLESLEGKEILLDGEGKRIIYQE